MITGENLAGSANQDGMPTLTFTRTRDLEGNAVAASSTSVVLSLVYGYVRQGVQSLGASFVAPPEVGVYSLTIRNVAGLETSLDDAFVVLPVPQVTSIDQEILCLSRSGAFAVTGTFERFGALNAGASFYGVSASGEILTEQNRTGYPYRITLATTGCRRVPFSHADVEICSAAQGAVPPEWSSFGRVRIAIQGGPSLPETRDVLLEVDETQPWPLAGEAVDADLTRTFPASFLASPGATPEVLLDTTPIASTPRDCVATGVGGYTRCSNIDMVIPQGTTPGDHPFTAHSLAGCTRGGSIHLTPAPQITAITPPSRCEFRPQAISVTGTGFEYAELLIDGTAYPCCTFEPRLLGLTVGAHQVAIQNRTSPRNLESSPATFTLDPGPATIWNATLTRLYSGATRPVFFPLSNVTGAVRSAALRPMSGPPPSVEFAPAPGGIEVTFPALGGDEYYGLTITDDSPCEAWSTGGFWTQSNPVLAALDFEAGRGLAFAGDETSSFETSWAQGFGNPGSSVLATAPAGTTWYFLWSMSSGSDLGTLSFDLYPDASGNAVSAPGVVLFAGSQSPSGPHYRLERALDRPAASAWTHFDVSFSTPDEWTYRDAAGTRPAVAEDFRAVTTVGILGAWWSGPNGSSAWLDNFVLELAR